MNFKNVSLISFAIAMFLSCGHQSGRQQKWYKGNLHTHSYWSDGDEFPEMIMDWYKSNGYNFVALSDHNILAEGDKWKLIPPGFIYKKAFEKYLNKYGDTWVEYKIDTGRTIVKLKPYLEYKKLFESEEEFLIIQGEEITDRFGDKHIHLNATNIQSYIGPKGGSSVVDVLQNNIDAVRHQRDSTGQPMMVHINHPNFHYSISVQDIISLKGERFFEVYNGHPQVNNYGDTLHPGTEEMWDMINSTYLNKGQPLIYGIATDDSHNYHLFGEAYSNAGRGWVMVLSESLDAGSLINSMEKGWFYASTGVVLENLIVEDGALNIQVSPEPGVQYEIQLIGVDASGKSMILSTVHGTSAKFQLMDTFRFVRAKVISNKLKRNPFHEGDYEQAWTQPVVTDG